jgi:hypothetical protein
MLSELTAAEQDWVRGNLGALVDLGISATPDGLGDLFDEQYGEWIALPADRRYDPNPIINVIGIGFGEYLRFHTGLTWMLQADEHGTDLVLAGGPEIVIAPTSVIAKRWTAGETGFLDALAASMIERVQAASRG